MISIEIMAETPEDLAEAVRKLTEPDKLFVSASEVDEAFDLSGNVIPLADPRRDGRKTIA